MIMKYNVKYTFIFIPISSIFHSWSHVLRGNVSILISSMPTGYNIQKQLYLVEKLVTKDYISCDYTDQNLQWKIDLNIGFSHACSKLLC